MTQQASLPRESRCEDTYFLDSRRALAAARAACLCPLPDGSRRPQYCYHPGPNPPNAPDNLIALPFNNFINYFLQHPDAMPSTIDCDVPGLSQDQRRQITEDFALLRAELLQAQRAAARSSTPATPVHYDTYFLDPLQALDTARQRNQVEEGHPRIKGLQICYYSGPPIQEQQENLIHIPEDRLLDFLCNTRMRLPSRIVYPPQATIAQQHEITATFGKLLDTAKEYRDNTAREFQALCRAQRPVFEGGPLRVFLPACRLTEVMQYCSKNLAVAFERLGHHARLTIEHNAMELLPPAWILKEHHEFQPHVVVNNNHLNNSWLHPEVFNVVWWQDPMPEIMQGQPLLWRERDIVFSVDPFFDEYIHRTGAREILRQHFCVNAEIFRPDPSIARQHKLVFLGSSYRDKFNHLDQPTREFVLQAMQRLEHGELIPSTEVNHQIPNRTLAHWIYNYIIRDSMVRWACELEGVTVDVYGRGWEHDPVVMAHFRGELPHGEAVARVYQEASHALVAHPWCINSQRLAEIAACGCSPVVYDVRHQAEPPHWESECLFFKTRTELASCLDRRPHGDPRRIAENLTYEAMARRIVDLVHQRMLQSPRAEEKS